MISVYISQPPFHLCLEAHLCAVQLLRVRKLWKIELIWIPGVWGQKIHSKRGA